MANLIVYREVFITFTHSFYGVTKNGRKLSIMSAICRFSVRVLKIE